MERIAYHSPGKTLCLGFPDDQAKPFDKKVSSLIISNHFFAGFL
jgi:hypothetical protein